MGLYDRGGFNDMYDTDPLPERWMHGGGMGLPQPVYIVEKHGMRVRDIFKVATVASVVGVALLGAGYVGYRQYEDWEDSKERCMLVPSARWKDQEFNICFAPENVRERSDGTVRLIADLQPVPIEATGTDEQTTPVDNDAPEHYLDLFRLVCANNPDDAARELAAVQQFIWDERDQLGSNGVEIPRDSTQMVIVSEFEGHAPGELGIIECKTPS